MKEIFLAFVQVFAMMAPWLVFGFLMAGIIAVWIPRAWVNRMMGGSSGFGGILRAVAIGVPLPICSCGVLPIAAGLRKHGAGKGPTAALLISTPQTGIDSILATYALLGPVFAVARPVAAALTGVVGGAVVSAVGGEDASTVAVEESAAGSRGVKAIFWQAYRRLLGSVAKPLAVGLAVSALVTVLVPDNFFADAFHGSDWIAMPVMAIVGFPMYVCSTASIPIAASLIAKGVSPGAAFVFLMVGPAMNAMSITTVAALVGRKAAAAYVAVIMIGAVLCGIAINFIPDAVPVPLVSASSKHALGLVHWASAVFLALMMVYNLVRPLQMGHHCATAK
ncbi:MAG: permease [Kiritimatiellae bacterium]|nr:permease [Kiritimatiellia bacterium]